MHILWLQIVVIATLIAIVMHSFDWKPNVNIKSNQKKWNGSEYHSEWKS